MTNEELLRQLNSEVERINQSVELSLRSIERLLEDARRGANIGHVAHNIGNRVTELAVLAGQKDMVIRVMRTVAEKLDG